MINKKRLVKTFKQLVQIDSLSLREGEIDKYLRKELRSLGLRVTEIGKPGGGEAGSLVAVLPGRGANEPRILLNAHTDTVSPGRKIRPVEKKGIICSDGKTILGADNKAGVAAILEVLRTLKEKKLPHPPLRIVFTVAEEIGLNGAKVLPARAFAADFGLVIDGGDINEIINPAPTQYSLNATVTGRAAHAGLRPDEGINAIKVASQAIARMKLGRIAKDTTANIGLIEGGTATNIVPERAEIKGEARSHNEKKVKRQVQQMEKALFDAGRRSGAQVRIRIERAYKAFEVKKTSEPVRLAAGVLKAAGIKYVIKKTGGGSDANIFNERGVPSIILGVGADKVHTTKENLPVADFVRGTQNILDMVKGAAAWQNLKKKK